MLIHSPSSGSGWGGSFPMIDQTLHWGQLRVGDGGVTIRVPFLQAQSRPELAQGSQRLLRACYVPGTCDYILRELAHFVLIPG